MTFWEVQFKIAIISKKQGREEYPCRNGKESSAWWEGAQDRMEKMASELDLPNGEAVRESPVTETGY